MLRYYIYKDNQRYFFARCCAIAQTCHSCLQSSRNIFLVFNTIITQYLGSAEKLNRLLNSDLPFKIGMAKYKKHLVPDGTSMSGYFYTLPIFSPAGTVPLNYLRKQIAVGRQRDNNI